MPRFFEENLADKTQYITGENARHITKSLRMKVGEQLVLCDKLGFEANATITSIEQDGLYVEIHEKKLSEVESSCKITLYQCLPKGDKLDLIVQKATELGVYEIVLVESKNCVAKISDKKDKKLLRLQKIALEAAKQSGRAFIPIVNRVQKFSEAVEKAEGLKLFCYEGKAGKLKETLKKCGDTVSVFVGPEGGFDIKEVELAKEKGFETVTLGRRILRTETAGLAAISIIQYETENM